MPDTAPLPLNRMIFITSNSGAAATQARLGQLQSASADPIHAVVLATPASLEEARGIAHALSASPVAVHTYAVGDVSSAGALIVAAPPAARRHLGDSVSVRFQELSVGSSGTLRDMQAGLEAAERQQGQLVTDLARACGQPEVAVERLMHSGRTLDARAAQAFGLGMCQGHDVPGNTLI